MGFAEGGRCGETQVQCQEDKRSISVRTVGSERTEGTVATGDMCKAH